MKRKHEFWPDRTERKLLGRFYAATGLCEALNVIWPFQFIYLYLIMERPEWAVYALLVESIAFLAVEIPAGVLADRWSRKHLVIAGMAIWGLCWGVVPLAGALSGMRQLLAVCGCFLFGGIAQTMVSGSKEAWVVDYLASAQRDDLVDQYFARTHSFKSLGGAAASGLGLLILMSIQVNQAILDLLWFITAAGMMISPVILFPIPEKRFRDKAGQVLETQKRFFHRTGAGFKAIWRNRPLFFFFWVFVIGSFAGSVADDVFDIVLVTKGMDARGLAPLGILDNLFCMVAPLLGVTIARRAGGCFLFVSFLIIPAMAVSVFFVHPGLWVVVGLYLLLDFFDGIWDPVAEAHLHTLIHSSNRATVASIVNQVSGLAEVGGIGVFALLLGEHSDTLQAAAPDLVEAFSGHGQSLTAVPVGLFGLPIPDLIIVFFIFSGLAAIPFIVLSYRALRQSAREMPVCKTSKGALR